MRNQQEDSTSNLVPSAVSKLMYITVVSMDNKQVQECTELISTIQSNTSTREELEITLKYIDNEYAKYTY